MMRMATHFSMWRISGLKKNMGIIADGSTIFFCLFPSLLEYVLIALLPCFVFLHNILRQSYG